MLLAVAVALAAGVGSVSRYVLDQLVQQQTASEFPYGTLVVNVTGSLFLGFVIGSSMHHGLSTHATMVLGSGVLGGYTTLSTWTWETLALVETGSLLAAGLNVVGSVAAGLGAAAAGFGLALL